MPSKLSSPSVDDHETCTYVNGSLPAGVICVTNREKQNTYMTCKFQISVTTVDDVRYFILRGAANTTSVKLFWTRLFFWSDDAGVFTDTVLGVTSDIYILEARVGLHYIRCIGTV